MGEGEGGNTTIIFEQSLIDWIKQANKTREQKCVVNLTSLVKPDREKSAHIWTLSKEGGAVKPKNKLFEALFSNWIWTFFQGG